MQPRIAQFSAKPNYEASLSEGDKEQAGSCVNRYGKGYESPSATLVQGTLVLGSIADDGECKICPAGWRAVETAYSPCQLCGVGRYQDRSGQYTCEDCPEGYWTDSTNATAGSACTQCPAGRYVNGTTLWGQLSYAGGDELGGGKRRLGSGPLNPNPAFIRYS